MNIKDVAKHAGVAISSVSAALNNQTGVSEATRERIITVARDLGYVPSLPGRSLSTHQAFAVGLIVRRDPNVFEADPFFGSFIAGIESALTETNYALIIQVSTDSENDLARYRQLAYNRRIDGVFLNELTIDDPRFEVVRELALPAVAISEGTLEWVPAVVQDHAASIAALVEHLVSCGHRRFAYVSGPKNYVHSAMRSRLWIDALRSRGRQNQVLIESDFTYAGGARAANEIVALGEDARPTAVFCANDLMAAGFLSRLQELGVTVPATMSVAGFDGSALSTYTRPQLTTIQSSPEQLGYSATRLLLDAIRGFEKEAPTTVTVVSRLQLRGSTGLLGP